MGVFDFFSRNRLKAVASERDDPQWAIDKALTLPGVDVVLTPSMTGMLRTSRLPRRGTIELLLAYERMPYLQSVIRKISKSAAAVPLRLFARSKKRTSKSEGEFIHDRSVQAAGFAEKHARLKALRQASELREIIDHPLISLLANPGCGFRGNMLMQMTYAWMDLVGEAFWVLLTNPVGLPNAILPIPPHWIRDLPSRSQPFFRVQIDSLTYEVPIDNVLWFRDPSLANPYGRGVGTGMALADELDVDENAAKHVGSFFYNRAMPDMIVSVEEADERTLKQTKAKFEQDHRGMLNAHRSAFMNGKASVTRLDTTFNDMNLIDLRKYSGRDVVIQAFGVSPEMLGIMDNSNRATVAEAREMFAENVLVPRLELIQTTLQELAERYDDRLIVVYDDPVPVNRDFALKVAIARPGSRSENEWRTLQDLDPVEGGDVFRVSPVDVVVENLGAGKRDLDGEAQAARTAAGVQADGGAVQDSALNGSQVTSMQAIAIAVAAGELPKASAIALLLASFPSLDETTARAIIDPIKEGSAPRPTPPKPGGGGKPVDDDGAPVAAPDAPVAEKAHRDIGAIVKSFEDDEIENVLESLRPERLTVETYDVLVNVIQDLGGLEAALVGAPGTFNMLNPLVTSYLAEYSTTKIKGLVDGTTREALRAALTEGVRAGEDVRRLSKRVESVFEDADRRRAIVIARTEVVGAANRGTYAAHVMSGVVNRRQWVPTPDARSRDTHKIGSKLAGQVRAIGERFQSDSGATALHPHGFGLAREDIQCFLPGTVVRGSFIAGTRALYDGPAVEIQARGGKVLRVTPNHPVLTSRGWLPAKEIKQGDHLLSYGVGDENSRSTDVDHGPSSVEDVYRALSHVGDCTTTVPTAEHFHGDAISLNGTIEVARAEGVLLCDGQSDSLQRRRDLGFVLPHMRTVSLSGASADDGSTISGLAASVSRSLPSGGQLDLNGGAVVDHAAPFQEFSGRTIAELDARALEARTEAGASDARLVRDLFQGLAGVVTLDQVVEVRDVQWSGHVFDLETESGLLVADGYITSNCRCTTIALVGIEPKSAADLIIEQRDFETRVAPFEEQFERGIKRGFKAQMGDVIAALEKAAQ